MKHYFTKTTTQAVIAWQNATTAHDKEIIYLRDLHPAFVKLAQITVNMRCRNLNATEKDIMVQELIWHCYDVLPKVKVEKLGKYGAFSFFNRCVMTKVLVFHVNRQKLRSREVHLHTKGDVPNDDRYTDEGGINNVADPALNAEEMLVENDRTQERLELLTPNQRKLLRQILQNADAVNALEQQGSMMNAVKNALKIAGCDYSTFKELVNEKRRPYLKAV